MKEVWVMRKKKTFIIGITSLIMIVGILALFFVNPSKEYSTPKNQSENFKVNEQTDNENTGATHNNVNNDNSQENDVVDNNQPAPNDFKQNSEKNDASQNKNNQNSTTTQNSSNNNTTDNNNNPNSEKNEADKSENPNTQQQPESTPISIDATKEFYCTGNYVLNGSKCEYQFSSDALIKYVCDEGTLSGNECKITKKISIPINTYSASYEICLNKGLSGYNLFNCACSAQGGTTDGALTGSYTCYKNATQYIDARQEYYCIDGTTLNGNKCVKTFITEAPFEYKCPDGYSLIGNKCIN